MNDAESNSTNQGLRRIASTPFWIFGSLVIYVLSSGPVLAGACWLREATHHDEFYYAFYLYWPLFYLERLPGIKAIFMPLHIYIEWWFQLFNTVGPG